MKNNLPNSQQDWLKNEKLRIAKRRELLRPKVDTGVDFKNTPSFVTGLALSGGGIRSATISIGMMQALAKADLLKQFDYLSTVSGGGYAGGFLCSLLMPEDIRQSPQKDISDDELRKFHQSGMDKLQQKEQRTDFTDPPQEKPISWLRNSGRYLAPNGDVDVWFGFTLWLRNLLGVHYVLGVTIICSLMLFGVVNHLFTTHIWGKFNPSILSNFLDQHKLFSPGLLFGVIGFSILVLAIIPLCIAYWFTDTPRYKTNEWLAGILTRTALLGYLMGPALWFLWRSWNSHTHQAPTENQDLVVNGLTVIMIVANCWYAGVWTLSYLFNKTDKSIALMQLTRTKMTKFLSSAVSICLGLLLLAFILIVCRQLLNWLIKFSWQEKSVFAIMLTTMLAIWKFVPDKISKPKQQLAVQWFPLVGAIFLSTLIILIWGVFASWLTGTKLDDVNYFVMSILLILATITGFSFQFLNLSTIQNLYTAPVVSQRFHIRTS
jgi:hypothetical protein